MGNVWAAAGGPDGERRKYMRSPDFDDPEGTTKLVSELGGHEYAGIVSIGPVGVGKSSNLNTVASYLNNRLEQQAGCGTGVGSLTDTTKTHLISYQGRPVKWKWLDTPGDLFQGLVEDMKQVELRDMECLPAQSAGGDGAGGCATMDEYSDRLEEVLLAPMRSHQVGCVMALMSAQELHSSTERISAGGVHSLSVPQGSRLRANLKVLKDLYPRLIRLNLRMVIVLTKVDLVDPTIDDNVANTAYSHDVHQLRVCVAKHTGVPLNQVHPVVNLVRDFDPMDNLELGQLALFNVRAALHAARQSEAAPVHPSRTSANSCNWDTLTFPSGVVSEDGHHGRSHPVPGGGAAGGGADGSGDGPSPGEAAATTPKGASGSAMHDRVAGKGGAGSVVSAATDMDARDHRSVSQPSSP